MSDRFIKNIMENSPVIILDKIKPRKTWTRLLPATTSSCLFSHRASMAGFRLSW
jgi:hypothetical protein